MAKPTPPVSQTAHPMVRELDIKRRIYGITLRDLEIATGYSGGAIRKFLGNLATRGSTFDMFIALTQVLGYEIRLCELSGPTKLISKPFATGIGRSATTD